MQNEAYGWVSLLLLALVTAHENHGCSQLWTEVKKFPQEHSACPSHFQVGLKDRSLASEAYVTSASDLCKLVLNSPF